jgi:hypothetical protein
MGGFGVVLAGTGMSEEARPHFLRNVARIEDPSQALVGQPAASGRANNRFQDSNDFPGIVLFAAESAKEFSERNLVGYGRSPDCSFEKSATRRHTSLRIAKRYVERTRSQRGGGLP